ncbi:porin family protein [Caldimonas brevitalea]|uniref:Outer membrane protein beta-barrel domain-containing protein n=1 Tax=Caldimonas brevitalea TaxID=413882 RepID=A0A0G3BXL1_9BURK|nr:porin family protein [Caldimonas brevitalea]AKJ32111.1 hypothetical protein AAW51_5420 [Caldimonas brevitalea]
MMKKLVLAALGVIASTAASAEGYAGLQFGTSRANESCEGTLSCDKSSSTYKLFGGYKFTPQLAAEASYTQYGKVTASVDVPPVVDLSMKASGFGFGLALHGDLAPSWTAVARFGLAFNKMKVNATVYDESGSDSDNTTTAYVGFGVGYKLTKALHLNATWDVSNAEYAGESLRFNLFSLGVSYGF